MAEYFFVNAKYENMKSERGVEKSRARFGETSEKIGEIL